MPVLHPSRTRAGFRSPIHDRVSRRRTRLYVGSHGRKSQPLVEARIAAIKSFQITLGAGFIRLHQRRFEEPRPDPLPLRRRRHAHDGQVPRGLVNPPTLAAA
jgi:hypothetical protein